MSRSVSESPVKLRILQTSSHGSKPPGRRCTRPNKAAGTRCLPVQNKTEILAAAWKQIADEGAAALSLRWIGRRLGITAPAIYNYYPDRDALVSALIIAAFSAFGDTLAQAVSALPEEEHIRRRRALGHAYRGWALTYPERYQLIFGTPIAGYHAPAEKTDPAAARSLRSWWKSWQRPGRQVC